MPENTNTSNAIKTIFMDDCDDLLPRDRSCTVVRISQFLIPGCLGKPVAGKYPGNRYAIVQPQFLNEPEGTEIAPERIQKDVERRAKALEKRLPITKAILKGELPRPGSPDPEIDKMRRYLAKNVPDTCTAEFKDGDIVKQFETQINTAQKKERGKLGRMLRRAGFSNVGTESAEELRETIRKVHYPEQYQSLKTLFPHVSFCAIFAQKWCHAGYTRGELITSIALAPGEELTLEVHSWTKEHFKSERELAVESEITLSNTLTARDHLEVVSKMTTETKIGSNAKIDVTIPVKSIPIGVGAGIDTSTNFSNALDTTAQQTTESTTEAASALKSQRRLRIEVAREVGSEEKQLRKVANTNRCHTLNVHYFEVLSNFEVSMELVDLIPCVLLPINNETVSYEWVLCHEHLLKGGLLSRTFLPGFAAAKILATQAVLEKQEEAAALPPAAGEAPAESDPIEQELHALRGDIVNAYACLLEVEQGHSDDIEELVDALEGFNIITINQIAGDLWTDLPKLFAVAVLRLNPTAVSALNALKDSAETGSSATSSLRVFFSAVLPRDFKHINPLGSIAGKALEELGIPENLTDILVFTIPDILNVVRDDCGLYVATKGAHERLADLTQALAITDSENTAQNVFETSAASAVFSEPESPFSNLQLAEAEVEFQRLKCHIDENRYHYFQLIWNSRSISESWRSVFPQLDCFLEHQPIGFVENKAAYPIKFHDFLRRFFPIDEDGSTSLAEFLRKLKEKFHENSRRATVITLPTLGTVAEAVLGRCHACEDYIVESRNADVRQQNAKAALAEAKARIENAEGERREKRISANPPDLSDPIEHKGGQIMVNVDTSTGNDTEG